MILDKVDEEIEKLEETSFALDSIVKELRAKKQI